MKESVLIVGGNDPSGGAGMSADLQVLNFLGTHAFSVLTTLTAQNYQGISKIFPVSKDFLHSQLSSVTVYPFDWVKLSLISDIGHVEVLIDFFSQHSKKIIFDPVMQASSGKIFWSEELCSLIKKRLLPLSYLVTPNVFELERFLGIKIESFDDCIDACRKFWDKFGIVLYLKGGHLTGEKLVKDYFYDGKKMMIFSVPNQKTCFNRGSGCRFSSALTAYLAKGVDINVALKKAKSYINESLKSLKKISLEESLLSAPSEYKEINVDVRYI